MTGPLDEATSTRFINLISREERASDALAPALDLDILRIEPRGPMLFFALDVLAFVR